jgi:hypothetical protein
MRFTLLTIVLLLMACGGSTSLAPIDLRAQTNQQKAAEAQISHLQGVPDGGCLSAGDLGAIESLAEAIYCGAGGTIQRAGLTSTEDAGITCPSQ